MNCFAHYLVMRTWIGSSLMAVLSGLINIVAVQELLTMNQLERAEVEILRKFILQSIMEDCLFIMNYPGKYA